MVLLESQPVQHPWSRYTYLAALPEAIITAHGEQVVIKDSGKKEYLNNDPWSALKNFREQQNEWLFGYLGYDLKNHLEKLKSSNRDAIEAPDMLFMVPGFLLEINNKNGAYNILKGDMPSEKKVRRNDIIEGSSVKVENLDQQTSSKVYIEKINEAQHRIREGEFYEINLSHQLTGDFEGDPLILYNRMKRVGPVPFGVYMQTKDFAICCQSPERFLRKEDRTVFSQPIKGTSQRGNSVGEDESLKQELMSSQKEKAENLMIVDLVRNDLSRIASRGSVNVPKLFDIESFGTVHQMVSTIRAQAEQEDPVTILKACFPMGSMTGAPKISTMKAIEELEEYRRGIYSGAIGYIRPNGDFDFNVVIRTAIIKGDKLYYAVGGAITSDSDPREEWKETMVKSQALFRALEEKEY